MQVKQRFNKQGNMRMIAVMMKKRVYVIKQDMRKSYANIVKKIEYKSFE